MYVGNGGKTSSANSKSLWNNAENTTLKSVTFAESKTVGDYVFTNLDVPTICGSAFSNCKNLATVKFPTYAFDVVAAAFKNCTSLTSVDLRHCRKLFNKAFYNCPSIGAVRFGDQLLTLGENVFSGDEGQLNTTLKSIVMPQFTYISEGVWKPTFDANAFSNLKNVKTVVIDPDVNKENYLASFTAWKTALGALKDNGLKVYVTAKAYNKLKADGELDSEDVTGFSWLTADDYRFMATATASGEALDKGYGTICLPSTVDLTDSYNVKTLYTAQYDGTSNAVTLIPVAADGAQPGQPYIYSRSDDDPSGLVVFSGNDANGTVTEPLADGVLTGTFTATTAPQGSYVLQTDNMFHVVGGTSIAVAPYRAYMTAPAAGSAEARLSIIEGEPTAIKGVTENATTDADVPMYNLGGQRIAAPVKGQIYIIKGKKIIK